MRPAVLWFILLLLLFHHFEVHPQTRNIKSRINSCVKALSTGLLSMCP